MKFLVNGRNYDLKNKRDVRDLETLASRVKAGFTKGLADPPARILAQINSAWRWLAGERKWWQ